jgi:ligand-binding SRPBCC domain-containing protein
MRIREFRTELWLPRKPSEVFSFFAEAANLEQLTPAWLGFKILNKGPVELRRGTLIDYRIRIRGFPVRWQTEITDWQPVERFTDEQRRGPYRLWRHEHTFAPQSGGTLCGDVVTYSTPLDFLVHRWWVRPEIERIFAYRRLQLLRRFGERSNEDDERVPHASP